MAGSKMIERQIAALKAMKGKKVEAGWFATDVYAGSEGSEPVSVARIARFLNRGGTIDHPGGTKYITDAVVDGRYVGTRFVHKDFKGDHKVTGPHQIVIPPRPFMQLAWHNFQADRSTIQKAIARDLVSGKISVDQALGRIGLALEGAIVKSMRNGNWTPNAKSTERKKGFNKPLIDDGHMIQTVSSVVS